MSAVRTVLLSAGSLVLLVLLVLFLVPLGRSGPRAPPAELSGRTATQWRVEGPFRAGAAREPIAVQEEAPLAGFPDPRRRWDGTGGPLYARALVVAAGDERVVLVSLETLLVSPDLEARIFALAGLAPTACVMVAATHTHSGPGGTWDNLLAAVTGNGRFRRAQRELLAQAAARAIARAQAQLQPARLRWAQAAWPEGPSVSRSGEPLDDVLTALQLTRSADGAVLATVVDYGMHPTVLGRASRALSGDWPGAAARWLEEKGGVGMILQGAVGNATWAREQVPPGREPTQELGGKVAARALALLANGVPSARGADLAEGPLSCSARLLPLPRPEPGLALPWALRRAAQNVLSLAADEAAAQVDASLGGLLLFGVPGEPVGALVRAFRDAPPSAAAAPSQARAVVGLADGYLGYVEAPDAARAARGESAHTVYGPGLAAALGLDVPPQAAGVR